MFDDNKDAEFVVADFDLSTLPDQDSVHTFKARNLQDLLDQYCSFTHETIRMKVGRKDIRLERCIQLAGSVIANCEFIQAELKPYFPLWRKYMKLHTFIQQQEDELDKKIKGIGLKHLWSWSFLNENSSQYLWDYGHIEDACNHRIYTLKAFLLSVNAPMGKELV